MDEQRRPAPRRPRPSAATNRDLHPSTFPALAVAFLAISMPMWLKGFDGEGALHFVSAAGFAFAALMMVLAALRTRRGSRRTSHRDARE